MSRAAERFPRRAAAFTLLEILLALALLALLIGLTVGVADNLFGDKSATPTDVFWQALTEARKEALTAQQDVRLAFDGEHKVFTVTDEAGHAQPFPVPQADKLTVDFLPGQKSSGNLILIGGEVVETHPLSFVTFYSDGTCTPFRAQFRSGGPAYTLAIDPWTCAEVLEEKK